MSEAVETCPHCGAENVYPNYDASKSGYVEKCKHCGCKLLLCDECLHSADNTVGRCDWQMVQGKGQCFRGSYGWKD